MTNPDREIDDEGGDPTPTADAASDRRSSCRYPVAELPILLSWWEAVEDAPDADGPSGGVVAAKPRAMASTYKVMMSRGPAFRRGFQASRDEVVVRREAAAAPAPESQKLRYCHGRLLVISQTGMAVVSESYPLAGQRAWVRLERPSPSDWVEVSLRRASPRGPGAHLVGLAFLEPCPYELFRASVYGKAGL